jgi:molybdenum cofactor cytidylyltransferase
VSESAVGIIVLAAGASRRMGEPKQLLRYGGETLLGRSVRAAFDSGCRPVVVVLGAHAEALRGEVLAEARVVVNPEWAEGMASSIRCGLAALEAATAGKARAVVLTLCDQPLVTGEVIGRLLAAYESGRTTLVASEYEVGGERTRGVPALFSRALFQELMRLRGAEGAKRIITRRSSGALIVAVPEAAFDVDTPEDYRVFKREAADNSEAG